MDTKILRHLLDLYICSDPWPLDTGQEEIGKFLDEESKTQGFNGWVEAYHYLGSDRKPPVKNGDHDNFCAVCGTPLDYRCIAAGSMGDTDVASCDECDATYTEGYVYTSQGYHADVPLMQLAYLQKATTTKQAEQFIRDQLGLT